MVDIEKNILKIPSFQSERFIDEMYSISRRIVVKPAVMYNMANYHTKHTPGHSLKICKNLLQKIVFC